MAKEVELKLALASVSRQAFLRHSVLTSAIEKRPVKRLFNIYFDTPDQALRAKGIALRKRKVGRQWLQTVKCAGEEVGGLSFRPEWEKPSNPHDFDFSDVDVASVRKFLEKHQAALQPAFETDFERRVWIFEPSPHTRLILAFDEGQIRSGDATQAISELEIEIAQGSADSLLKLGLQLAQTLSVRPETLSKAERGFALALKEPLLPIKTRIPCLHKTDSPRAAFRQIVLSSLAHIQANAGGVLHSDDPEFVHQMRVGLRRLRSAMRSFRPILPTEFMEQHYEALGTLARQLGRLRDKDVLSQEILPPVLQAHPEVSGLRALHEQLHSDRRQCQDAVRAAIHEPHYGRLTLSVLAAVLSADFVLTQSPNNLSDFATERLKKTRLRLAKRAQRAQCLDVGALHSTRIAAKRLRYALEYLGEVASGGIRSKSLQPLTELQDCLGTLNDMSNARQYVLGLCARQPEFNEAWALIEQHHQARISTLLAELPGRLNRFSAP